MSERLGFYLSVLTGIFLGCGRDLFYLNKGSAASLKRKLELIDISDFSAEDSYRLFRGIDFTLSRSLERDEASRKPGVRQTVFAENIQLRNRARYNEVKAFAEVEILTAFLCPAVDKHGVEIQLAADHVQKIQTLLQTV